MPNQERPLQPVVLGQYKDLAVTRRLCPVSEAEVEQELLHERRLHAHYQPTDRPAGEGSRVTLDFWGELGGAPIPDSRMTNVTLLLGSGKLMPAAEQAVYGHCAGEEFTFDFTYPLDFQVEHLAGQTAQFTVRLHTVAEKQVPGADDAFAKTRGYDSLEVMKAAIRKKKQAPHEAAADRRAAAELLDMAGANLTVTLSEEKLDAAAHQELAQLSARLGREGRTLEQYCREAQITPAELDARCRADAERRVRGLLAAQAIAEAEQITVTDPEIRAEYRRLSALQNQTEDEVRRRLRPEVISAALTTRKVQDFLLAHARVTTLEGPAEHPTGREA